MCVDRCVRVSVCSMMCSLCTFCIIFFNEEEKSFFKKVRQVYCFFLFMERLLGYPKFTIKSVL